ncbi:MAG: TPR end-of-group domain-containing protein [Planctomycetota bacterium]
MRWVMVLLLAAASHAQDRGDRFTEQETRAFELYEKKNYNAAIAAFELQITIFPDSPRPYYNIACCYALQGDAARAATWLDLAVQHGWRNTRHLDADPDFAGVRETDAYKRVRKRLGELPPVLPRRVDPRTVAPASSVMQILAEGVVAQAQLDLDERLYEPSQVQTRLFSLYDHQMARLARYIDENGDARDAHVAGRERVRIASLYRVAADRGTKLDEVASTYVKLTAEEFVERWPTSPYLYEIRLWRASVDTDDVALQKLLVDAPRGPVAARAMAELMMRDESMVPTLYARFQREYGQTDVGRELLAARLWKTRLQVEGVPEGLEFDPPVDLGKGRWVLCVVTAGDRIPAGDRVALIVLGESPWTGRDAPRAKRPLEAARALGVPTVPILLTFEDGKLVEAN